MPTACWKSMRVRIRARNKTAEQTLRCLLRSPALCYHRNRGSNGGANERT
jgi:hypothetical protein